MDIFKLIQDNNADSVKVALVNGTCPNLRNDNNETLLIVAAGLGKKEIVNILLCAGADIDLVNNYEFSALGSALWCSYIDVAEELVSHGAKISIDSAAALGDVTRLNHEWPQIPAIEEMIGPYLAACRTGAVVSIRWFLDRGVPVDLHPPGSEWGGIGCSGLHHAAVNGHVKAVQLLLENGADMTLVDDVYGSQALAWAAGAEHEKVISALLDAGADLKHKNTYNLTASELAYRNGFKEIAICLQ